MIFFTVTSTIRAGSPVINGIIIYNTFLYLFYLFYIENQGESIEESTSTSMIDQLSRQFTTNNGNTSNSRKTKDVYYVELIKKIYFSDESIELSLLHPLNEQLIEKKTDRYIELMDCFHRPPVLIVVGINNKILSY